MVDKKAVFEILRILQEQMESVMHDGSEERKEYMREAFNDAKFMINDVVN